MSQSTPKGRPPGDHDARRVEVVEAAWQVIYEHGIDKASLRSIARAAGCTTGVISHYFHDKDELLAFAIESLFARIRDVTRAFAEAPDPLDALRNLYLALLPLDRPRQVEWSVWLSFLGRGQHHAGYAGAILAWHSEFRARLQALMARGQDMGCIRRDVPAAMLADQFNATLDGLSLMAPFERERFPEPYLRQLMEHAISQLQPAADPAPPSPSVEDTP